MRNAIFGVLFLTVSSLAGCTESPKPSPDIAGVQAPADSESNALTLTVYTTVYDDNEDTDGTKVKTIEQPTPEAIREQFNALNWDDPHHDNAIGLHRGRVNTPDYITLTVGGTLNPRSADEQMEANWSELPSGQTVWKHLHFAPITSKEQAIELLVSFLAQDDKYRTAV